MILSPGGDRIIASSEGTEGQPVKAGVVDTAMAAGVAGVVLVVVVVEQSVGVKLSATEPAPGLSA